MGEGLLVYYRYAVPSGFKKNIFTSRTAGKILDPRLRDNWVAQPTIIGRDTSMVGSQR